MDGSAFDALARRVGTRRGLMAALAAALAGAVAHPASARRRRRECGGGRPCGNGFACRKRRCVCDSGIVCSGACCAAGLACRDGQCQPAPEPPCLALGEACKNAGVGCCPGLACGSGQGGVNVACYAPAGAACRESSECVYGSSCIDGVCVATPGPDPAPVCDVVAGPDPVANGHALIAAIAAAPAGATVGVGPGDYEVLSPGGAPVRLDRDLAIAACGGQAPRLRLSQPRSAVRGVPVLSWLFDIGSSATLSVTGMALDMGDIDSDITAFRVTDNARLVLTDCTVSGFTRGIRAISSSRIELRGGVRITGSSSLGINLIGVGTKPYPPELSRIACSGAGNLVSGSGMDNCLWAPSVPAMAAICPDGCGCGCPADWPACSGQICVS